MTEQAPVAAAHARRSPSNLPLHPSPRRANSWARICAVLALLGCSPAEDSAPAPDQASPTTAAAPGPARPAAIARNLVLVVLDTVRPDHLGLYGYPRPTSPALDLFAANALVFDNAQSVAPWTAPALISLVTSLLPAVHGVREFPEPARVSKGATTLAEILKSAGYDTAAFTEGGYAKGDFGLDRGVDLFPRQPGDEDTHSSNLHAPSRLASNVERAQDWLESRGADPFFLLFHTYEAHEPYRAPERIIRLFRPDYDEAAEHAEVRAAIERWNRGEPFGRDDARVLGRHEPHCALAGQPALERTDELRALRQSLSAPSPAEIAEQSAWLRDLYDAELRYTDEVLAQLWAGLEERGQLADTVVAIVSDHGEGFGEHGHFGHGRLLYEELLRIAWIVRAPGQTTRRVAPTVRSIDLMPTVLDWLGVDSGRVPMQGVSLAPWLAGEADPLRLAAHSGSLSIPGEETRLISIRSGPWRLVNVAGTRELALYDLRSDPAESRSVAAENVAVVRELFEQLERQAQRDAKLRAQLGEPTALPPLAGVDLDELKALGYVEGD